VENPLLHTEELSLHFGGVKAVDNLTCSVDEREIVALIGPNGAGKTTVFNVLTGIYKPIAGDARLKGKSVIGFKPNKIVLSRTFDSFRT
jgi:ABC-type branched-subunit amino acid transport system ATPase component